MSIYFAKCENCIALSRTIISYGNARPYFAHSVKNAFCCRTSSNIHVLVLCSMVGCCSSDAIITPKGMPEVGVLVEKNEHRFVVAVE